MKRIIALIMAASMAVLAGCGSAPAKESSAAPESAAAAENTGKEEAAAESKTDEAAPAETSDEGPIKIGVFQPLTFSSRHGSALLPYPRVQHGIQAVRQQASEDYHRGRQQGGPLQQRDIPPGDGLHHQAAHAVDGEHGLGDHRAGQET